MIFSFVFYTTGALILRVITFGSLRKPIFGIGVFNAEKRLGNEQFGTAYLTGMIFYMLLIALVAWLN
ncbi:hypothetical protein BGP75_09630 [Motiliproteus sp. MSK22-1]|nr:hypothetical protein BGP75_09630 [Motiliproteus sp. MSK22-1]